MPRKKKPKPEPFDLWACLLCPRDAEGDNVTFEAKADFTAHVRDLHPELVDAEDKIAGKREFVSHIGCRGYDELEYAYWTLDGTHFASQLKRTVREKGDPRNFM